MAIVWVAGAAAGEAIGVAAGTYTAYEIGAALAASGWIIAAGVAWWYGTDRPYAPPNIGFCWAGGETGKEQDL